MSSSTELSAKVGLVKKSSRGSRARTSIRSFLLRILSKFRRPFFPSLEEVSNRPKDHLFKNYLAQAYEDGGEDRFGIVSGRFDRFYDDPVFGDLHPFRGVCDGKY